MNGNSWRALELEFEGIDDPGGCLRADYVFRTDTWEVLGSVNKGAKLYFEDAACWAARFLKVLVESRPAHISDLEWEEIRLERARNGRPARLETVSAAVAYWLNALKAESPGAFEVARRPDASGGPAYEYGAFGSICNVIEHSAQYCRELAMAADDATEMASTGSDATDSPTSGGGLGAERLPVRVDRELDHVRQLNRRLIRLHSATPHPLPQSDNLAAGVGAPLAFARTARRSGSTGVPISKRSSRVMYAAYRWIHNSALKTARTSHARPSTKFLPESTLRTGRSR